MKDTKRKLATAIATGALLLNAFAPLAMADTTIQISGNGSNSNNTSNVNVTQNTTVVQNNTADVTNNVDVDADTGDNDAEDNTGGDVSIDTGDADVNVSVSNTLNSNSANVDCCQNGDTEVLIQGNGTYSDNDANLNLTSNTVVGQNNYANVKNDVDVDADTGDNDAEDNTGGDVTIDTGDADVNVDVDNALNFNWADVNCGCLLEDLLVKIDGNGTDSDNDINADLSFNGDDKDGSWQNNAICLNNDLDELEADTGDNDNEDNTAQGDSDPSIDTGDADVDVDVNNSGNVNVINGDSALEIPEFNFDVEFSLSLSELLGLLGLLS